MSERTPGERAYRALAAIADGNAAKLVLAAEGFKDDAEFASVLLHQVESDKNWIRAQRDVAEEKVESKSETATRDDPGMIKLLSDLVDRMYKMNLMAIPSLRVTEQNPDSNDPIVAWMSDVRSVLYRNKPAPDLARDLGNIK